ncbi:MAG: hypothetical protein RIR00_1900 [Pseudomonadota bacterium]
MHMRHLLIAIFLWPLHAISIGPPVFSSDISGVQLWALSKNSDEFPGEWIEEEDNEFIRHCNGTHSVHVSSINTPIRCQSEAFGRNNFRVNLMSKDRRLSGLVIVSIKSLLPRIKPLPISIEESEMLRKAEATLKINLADDAKRGYLESFPTLDPFIYTKLLREIKQDPTYRKHGDAQFKIQSSTGLIYISAVGLFPNGIGWDIKNVVFRMVDGKPIEMGTFYGCIEGFRDLNADGTPEVLTRLCANDEGTVDIFWSLTPTVRPVVTRSQ